MSPELTGLARRAVACPRFRWMDGMLATGPGWFEAARISTVDVATGMPDLWEYRGYIRGPCAAGRMSDTSPWEGEAWPVLDDPATLGCLLALVRELWARKKVYHGVPIVHVTECDGRWEFGYRYGEVLVSCYWANSEVEALVWALEAGP